MILSSGVRCDVCDMHILLDKSINPFKMSGIDDELHCHDRCKDVLLKAIEAQDWKLLPEGPIRRTFQYEENERCTEYAYMVDAWPYITAFWMVHIM